MYLESRRLAANTINQQLAAVRRLAHEAADAGLLSPDLAAGIGRVKGVKQLGHRSGNWLRLEQSSEVLSHARGEQMREKRRNDGKRSTPNTSSNSSVLLLLAELIRQKTGSVSHVWEGVKGLSSSRQVTSAE
ncbi:MAG TPA: hypothetical protein VHL05_14525 [Terriglobales bacterium]|jgi:hypothetical protein|nr:hypothetical protein [Terriglobales bacterium]